MVWSLHRLSSIYAWNENDKLEQKVLAIIKTAKFNRHGNWIFLQLIPSTLHFHS